MSSASEVVRTDPWRRMRERVLVICAVWLVVQNVLLLALLPWGEPVAIRAVASALVHVAAPFVAPLWVILVAAFLGTAFSAYLARRHFADAGAHRWETRDERAS